MDLTAVTSPDHVLTVVAGRIQEDVTRGHTQGHTVGQGHGRIHGAGHGVLTAVGYYLLVLMRDTAH